MIGASRPSSISTFNCGYLWAFFFVQYKTIANKRFVDILIFFAHFQTFTSKVLKNMPDLLSTPQLHDKWLCHTLKLLLYAVPQINEKKLNFVIYLIIPLAPVQFIVYSIYRWTSLLWTNDSFLTEQNFCEQWCRSEEFSFKNCLGTFFTPNQTFSTLSNHLMNTGSQCTHSFNEQTILLKDRSDRKRTE